MESNPSEQTEMTEEGLFKESHKGKIKDKYHFSEKLASGGFGIVYKAEDRKTGKKFAIKTIQKKKLKDFQTFVNEVKILQALVSTKSYIFSLFINPLGPSEHHQALRDLGVERCLLPCAGILRGRRAIPLYHREEIFV